MNRITWLILLAVALVIVGELTRVLFPAVLLALLTLGAAGWLGLQDYLKRIALIAPVRRTGPPNLREALQRGSLADALIVWAASADGEQQLSEHLDRRLDEASQWQVSIELKHLAKDLLLLERSRQRAIDGGVEAVLFEPVTAETAPIADGLWAEASRLSSTAVGRDPESLENLSALLATREQEFTTLRHGVAEARDELNLLVLSGGGGVDTDAQLAAARERLEAASSGLRWLNSPPALPDPDSQ